MSSLNVVYEDSTLLLVNKPSGIVTDQNLYESKSIESLGHNYLTRKSKRHFLGLPHRLDKPTSGLLILTKKKSTLKQLNQWFADRKIQKTYLAITSTPPKPAKGILEHHLFTDKAAKKALVYDHPKGGTKPARLHYRTLEVNEHGALLEVKPSTGRFHQIRAQLSHIGCPILGDEKYGGSKLSPNTIALHAWKIKLPEALNESPIEFETLPRNGIWGSFKTLKK